MNETASGRAVPTALPIFSNVLASGVLPATTAPLDAAFASGAADLRSVYDEHGGLIYAICRKALDEHSAKDVTQEVFVSAWKASRGTPSSYPAMSSHPICSLLQYLRRKGVRSMRHCPSALSISKNMHRKHACFTITLTQMVLRMMNMIIFM